MLPCHVGQTEGPLQVRQSRCNAAFCRGTCLSLQKKTPVRVGVIYAENADLPFTHEFSVGH